MVAVSARAGQAVLAASFLLAALSPAASGLSWWTVQARFPENLSDAAVAWTGESVYAFGGRSEQEASDRIWRFHLATGGITLVGERLPVPRAHAAAAFDGRHIYVFGGFPWNSTNQPGPLQQDLPILRFDPANQTIEELPVRMPEAHEPAVAWDGRHVVVFSRCGTSPTCPILRFDPVAGTLEPSQAVGGSLFSTTQRAVSDGRFAYVQGHWFEPNNYAWTPVLMRYDSWSDEAVALPSVAPWEAGAVPAYNKGRIYLLGGWNHATPDRISIYDTATGNLTLRDEERLPAWAHGLALAGVQKGNSTSTAIFLVSQPNGPATTPLGFLELSLPEDCTAPPMPVECEWPAEPEKKRPKNAYKPPPDPPDREQAPDGFDGCAYFAPPEAQDSDRDGTPDLCEGAGGEPTGEGGSAEETAGVDASAGDGNAQAPGNAPERRSRNATADGPAAKDSPGAWLPLLGLALAALAAARRR